MSDRSSVEDMPGIRVRPLRRVEYDLLVEQGMLTTEDRIELLDGELVTVTPQNAPHAGIVEALNERLMPELAGTARVRVQLPFAATEHSEPGPDIAIVPADEPRNRHPQRALLVIEVADASVRLDLVHKARIYAAAGVPAYWVIDINDEVVHVHADPSGDGYATVTQHGPDEPLDAAGVTLTLRELTNAG